jgi:hypothetical protein
MASFSDLVRAQRQSGKGVVTSLSGAYNQMNLQRYDPRNALFSKGGLMTSLFPGLKGYQASPVSGKSPSSMVSPEISGSPTALSSIARDARISARNSMALPSIARNMSQMVRIWGGTPAKYFEKAKAKEEAYEAKQGGGKRGFASLGKSAGGGGFNIMGMLGGALGGIGSVLGSVVGGVGSVIGSILGGIGSLLGGAASGVFGILSSALGGMGMFGVILAAASGFVLYQIFKNADFSSLGKGISGTLESIQSALSGIFNDVDDVSGNRLSSFINDVKAQFKEVTIRITSALEVAAETLMKFGAAVLKDFGGYFKNFFEENKGKIYALMAIGIMGPRALLTLPGAAITAIAGAVGAATGEYDLDTLEKQRQAKLKDLEDFRKNKTRNIQTDFEGYESLSDKDYEKKLNESIGALDKKIEEKKSRTSNFQTALNEFSTENLATQYGDRVNQKMAAATGASTAPSPAGPLSGANLLDMIGAKEGGKMGYDAANKGKAGDMPQGYPGLSKLTVGQVMEMQARKEIFAAGKYQIIPSTLEGLVASKVVKREDPFSPVVQDKLAMELINRRLKTAGSDPVRQQFELSKEFASIENPYTGSSYYAGKAGNKSLITSNQMQTALRGGNIGGGTPMASAPPPPTPSRTAGSQPPKPSAADTAAAFAADQIMALDKMMGGQLLKGSSQLADMLRDITREFMNNPTFVDSSQTVNNNQPGLTAATTGGGYSVMNPDAVALMVDKTTYHYAPYRS